MRDRHQTSSAPGAGAQPITGRYIQAGVAAEYAGVTRRTIYDWITRGLLRAVRPVARGSGRVLVEVESLRRVLGEVA